jgi:DNA-binding MarR family transcriptional regulator
MEALARRTDPETSHEAAALVNVTKAEAKVLLALRRENGTWDEITARTGMRAGTVSPRFRPLREKGLIRQTGEVRPGESGAKQTVWDLTADGMLAVEAFGEQGTATLSAGTAGTSGLVDPTDAAISAIDAVTDEEWDEVLNGQMQMKGWFRTRVKRLVRVLALRGAP